MRSKPLSQFTVEDLITMIGQRIGLEYLTPIALDVLKENPWATTDLYLDGVLLATVLRIKPEFWIVNHDWARALQGIVGELGPLPPDCDPAVQRLIDRFADTIAIVEKELRRGPQA